MINRDMKQTDSTPTIAKRFFTMVNMDTQSEESMGITDLVTQSGQAGNRSNYMPTARKSSYVVGMINSIIFGEDQASQGWDNRIALSNDAIGNQDRMLSSLGSATISFNISQNMKDIRNQVNLVVETSERDKDSITREIELAISNSFVKSTTKQEFVSELSNTYREIFTSTDVLHEVYDNMQNLAINISSANTNKTVDFELLANGQEGLVSSNAEEMKVGDPIAETNLVPKCITPQGRPGEVDTVPAIVAYEEQSPNIKNAVLVNNLVIPGRTFQSTGAGSGGGGGGTGGY